MIATTSTMSTTANPSLSPATAIDGPEVGARQWSIESAYQFCERLARSHYENFPVGSVLVKKDLRKYFYSIYAFARIADDFADEGYDQGYTQEERLEWLARWKEMLADAYRGQAGHPVFMALADTAGEFDLPKELFDDLLSAFSQDVVRRRYGTFDELLDYCRRSANPIGRLILLLFGYSDPDLLAASDQICTGLQLANHWQDAGIDLEKDRVYLPLEDMSRFGVTIDGLKSRKATEEFRSLMAFETSRARELFAGGKPLCTSVPGRLGLELRVVWLGGSRILDLLEKGRYDVFENRPEITGAGKLRILVGALLRGAF
ncbi:MAG TPA: squalene synthase HpnC [Blastocatellia bacterium]|nr:squalene synthase HpnC [Blastocatellia bacterium]